MPPIPALAAMLAALLAAVSAGAAAAPPRPLAEGRSVAWSMEGGAVTYRSGSLLIRLTVEHDAGGPLPVVRVEAPGRVPAVLRGDSAMPYAERRIGVARLTRGSALPDVIYQDHSGGAHCCTLITIVRPRAGGFDLVALGDGWDGAPREEMSRDLDGDGIADWVMRDDAFLYRFSSYAQSIAPPEVLNVVGTRVVDVSARPAFAGLFRETLARAGPPCLDRQGEWFARRGACPAYLAAAARLGRIDEAWARLRAAWTEPKGSDWGCRIDARPCPAGERVRDYPEAVAEFLIWRGYLPKRWGRSR
ncbi:hypothetical protein E2493_19155 [Sphingomonas parva]|uniref:VCBS repeat-containing protein n=1 Tax=Sphingomonas parva TaxID=2555898 RepID=A0A4Y8ZKU7_9SPHN|nr:hypothetical protein [Sphingomonas parva]TFI56631.1 hypothetical protein E2493_19155 [Sphingomonas parva]